MDILGMGEARGIRTTHNVLSGFLIQGSQESGVESLHCTHHHYVLQLRLIRYNPSETSTVSKVKEPKYREGQLAFFWWSCCKGGRSLMRRKSRFLHQNRPMQEDFPAKTLLAFRTVLLG